MLKLVMWYLDWRFSRTFEGIDMEKMRDWLIRSFEEGGFKHYFKYRDFTILKQLGIPQSQEKYWQLIGARGELLHLIGVMSDEYKRFEKEQHAINKKGESKR